MNTLFGHAPCTEEAIKSANARVTSITNKLIIEVTYPGRVKPLNRGLGSSFDPPNSAGKDALHNNGTVGATIAQIGSRLGGASAGAGHHHDPFCAPHHAPMGCRDLLQGAQHI